ncbi:MAG: NADH-quinone oxidoreductase subunit C [Gammaproteobacteria bacterium RIFCSPHIGHO2_12_FULL_45_9]|nr:MAG: NADH-quinone oxidoreductase subunit C [Gammaproteobacteria bacterium RIFCSPHIGHO2_12_FULL_45_9]
MNDEALWAALSSAEGNAHLSRARDGMPTLEWLQPAGWLEAAALLKADPRFQFDLLLDVSGMDYHAYGQVEWRTEPATRSGFSRGVYESEQPYCASWNKPRFAVVYHFVSTVLNHRLRVRVFAENNDMPVVPSVFSIWNAANWYEREAFDLFGIHFEGHPDLRRLLTDYGFVGHPFRKDFPLIGEVELRYDAKEGRCVYEPVSIAPRTLVPKVIRMDNRYLPDEGVS